MAMWWLTLEAQIQRYGIPLLLTGLLIWGVDALVTLAVEAQWFNQLGFGAVLWTRVAGRLGVGGVAFAIAWLGLWSNLRFACGRPLSLSVRAAVALVSLGLSLGVQQDWLEIVLSGTNVGAGERDPILGMDIGFYFFVLPVWLDWQQDLFTLGSVVLGATAVFYGIQLGLSEQQITFRLPDRAIRHLLVLVALLFVLRSWRHFLAIFELLYSQRGSHYGATYTDVWAQLPIEGVLAVLCLALTGWILRLIFNLPTQDKSSILPHYRVWGVLLVCLGIYGGTVLVFGQAWPRMLQAASVDANELERELPYIEHNIRWTQKGFNLTGVTTYAFTLGGSQEAALSELTLKNIPLWDPEPLLVSYQQLQEIRLYYELHEADVDRYRVNNQLRQVMISARELDYQRIPKRAQTWVNEHFFYTHGYGVALSPVNAVSPAGLPEFWVKDIPPVVTQGSEVLGIRQPGIYFGESTTTHVFVKTDAEELDYPSGDRNILADYQGDAGIPAGTPAQRLLLAWYLRDPRFVLTTNLNRHSRFLLWRQVQERIRRIAPFLVLDPNPYLVIDDGQLFWIQDAYTVSDRLPYSEPAAIPPASRWEKPRFVNYIRNSLKIVVNAYDGRVTFYRTDDQDPLLKSYEHLFPGLVRPSREVPPGLARHFRYPEYLFRLQTQQYALYHMRDPRQFYNKEDQWDLIKQVREGGSRAQVPYYQVLQLPTVGPQNSDSEMVLLTSFTPHNRQNLIAWMAARCDQSHYGELLVYEFSKQELILGPQQVEARIAQDPQISAQLSLWNEAGSRVSFGNLLVIPLPKSLIYVQPIYLEAENSRLPQLIRVVVADQEQVIMAPRLEEALAQLFPGQLDPVSPPSPEQRLTEQAWAQWQEAQTLWRLGRTEEYEVLQRQLGATLTELYQLQSSPR